MHFGGLLSITCKELRHALCLWLIQNFDIGLRKLQVSTVYELEVTPAAVNELFGLPIHGRILKVFSVSSEHPFRRIYDIRDRLLSFQLVNNLGGPSFFMHVL